MISEHMQKTLHRKLRFEIFDLLDDFFAWLERM